MSTCSRLRPCTALALEPSRRFDDRADLSPAHLGGRRRPVVLVAPYMAVDGWLPADCTILGMTTGTTSPVSGCGRPGPSAERWASTEKARAWGRRAPDHAINRVGQASFTHRKRTETT
jgi:hypothetical protein